MDRIAIIGRSGGGKSSLARRLAQRLALPIVHLDQIFWLPGWRASDEARFRSGLGQALAGGRWISDGTFAGVADLHLAQAQLILWIDQPRHLCLRRVVMRALTGLGRRRADVAEGCPERIDPYFLRYIWNWDRDSRPQVEAALALHAPLTPVVRLTSDRQIADWLRGLDYV